MRLTRGRSTQGQPRTINQSSVVTETTEDTQDQNTRSLTVRVRETFNRISLCLGIGSTQNSSMLAGEETVVSFHTTSKFVYAAALTSTAAAYSNLEACTWLNTPGRPALGWRGEDVSWMGHFLLDPRRSHTVRECQSSLSTPLSTITVGELKPL